MIRGFSLLELLITLSIMGILAAISYPIYTVQVSNTHRQNAVITLMELSNRLEEQHALKGSYEAIDINPLIPESAHQLPFKFKLSQATQNEYLLEATPTDDQSNNEPCHTLMLSSDGSHCW